MYSKEKKNEKKPNESRVYLSIVWVDFVIVVYELCATFG